MKQPDRKVSVAPLLLLMLACLISTSWAAETVDHSIYGALLMKYVKDGVVDYGGLKKDEGALNAYLRIVDRTNPDELLRDEQFAFYINAYNAYTINLILKHYPLDSIKDIGGWLKGPWKIRFCQIGGKAFTLDEIEHNILRPRFKGPRVHFAVNCASNGCPPLISEPYQGGILDQQLDRSTRRFLNDPKRNRLEGNTLYVSKIFKWFEDDFNGDIVGFFLRYAEDDLKNRLLAQEDQIKVKHLHYDWSLNGR